MEHDSDGEIFEVNSYIKSLRTAENSFNQLTKLQETQSFKVMTSPEVKDLLLQVGTVAHGRHDDSIKMLAWCARQSYNSERLTSADKESVFKGVFTSERIAQRANMIYDALPYLEQIQASDDLQRKIGKPQRRIPPNMMTWFNLARIFNQTETGKNRTIPVDKFGKAVELTRLELRDADEDVLTVNAAAVIADKVIDTVLGIAHEERKRPEKFENQDQETSKRFAAVLDPDNLDTIAKGLYGKPWKALRSNEQRNAVLDQNDSDTMASQTQADADAMRSEPETPFDEQTEAQQPTTDEKLTQQFEQMHGRPMEESDVTDGPNEDLAIELEFKDVQEKYRDLQFQERALKAIRHTLVTLGMVASEGHHYRLTVEEIADAKQTKTTKKGKAKVA